MPRKPYTVKCPSCSAERETRAAARMVLRCLECGERFRIPSAGTAGELPDGELVASPADPAPAAPAAPAAPPEDATVRPVVAPPAPDPDPDDDGDQDDDAERPPPRNSPEGLVEAGRRGGRTTASYRRRRRGRG